VAFRIFSEHVEVDVLRSDTQLHMPDQAISTNGSHSQLAAVAAAQSDGPDGLQDARIAAMSPASPVQPGAPGQPAAVAEWMATALREGLTQEAAARQLGVSVKTVSRWVGGTTEPRMRDLRRIQEVFGALPLP
jgi:hypothetical protein